MTVAHKDKKDKPYSNGVKSLNFGKLSTYLTRQDDVMYNTCLIGGHHIVGNPPSF